MPGFHRLLAVAFCLALPALARAQPIDMSSGGPVTVTAAGGIDWDQKAQTVTAYGQARAVRGTVTVDADRLVAFSRKKQVPGASTATASKPAAPAPAATLDQAAGGAAPDDTGSNEIYRLLATGHVHIYTATDQAWGDRAVYDIDQAVMVLTGGALKLTTPTDLVTARDSMEYWPPKRMSVARGDAIITTNDGRRIQADIIVGFSAPTTPPPGGKAAAPVQKVAAKPGADPLTSSGKLERAEAYGDVVVRTQIETVRGERGVYIPDTGIARIVGNVRITRGQNELDGQAAIVNMKTGLATLSQDPGERVQGLIVPNDQTTSPASGAKPAGKPGRGGTAKSGAPR